MSTPDLNVPSTTHRLPSPSKPPRVLACVLCQQRKIKCDRKFPCTHCIKSQAQCVPAGLLPRRRKRRFPERDLLDKLRQYETLLRQHNIQFEPLHKDSPEDSHLLQSLCNVGAVQQDGSEAGGSSPSTTVKSEPPYEAKNFWNAMNQVSRESDDSDSASDGLDESVVKKAWDQVYENTDPLFGSRKSAVNLSSLHPEPAQVFRLWQIYLENVNPLLKVTHIPTLQARIIEAMSDTKSIKPTLEALMFSIYCVAVLSVPPEDCQALLGGSKEELLSRYQFCCQQALVNTGFMRSDDRECLTAFYFYLIAIRPTTDPRSLSSMFGIATRMAQRMGLQSEAACAKYPPLEAEMRRRLWWALVLVDSRIGEMANYRSTPLTPIWDCNIPLNVNDLELRPGMKEPPPVQANLTEMLFVLIRSEVGNYVRYSIPHLEFTYPVLRPLARTAQMGSSSSQGPESLDALESFIEEKYLKFCDPEDPIHLLATWTFRSSIARSRLMEHYAMYINQHQTEAQRDAALSYAIYALECDTKTMSSPLSKRFAWLLHFHFPFPPFIHILQDLRRRPLNKHAEYAWELMSNSFVVRMLSLRITPSALFRSFTKLVLQSWGARQSAFRQLGKSPPSPLKMIVQIKEAVSQNMASSAGNSGATSGSVQTDSNVPIQPAPVDFGADSLPCFFTGEDITTPGAESWMYMDMAGLGPGEMATNQFDWSLMDLGS